MATAKPIVVIGSINMDLVCRTERIPGPGETVMGDRLLSIPGGKGANQAVAAAKLANPDTPVYLVGRVGDDDFGARLLNGLQQHRVRTNHVTITEGASSGCALINVDRAGENSIVVAPGANAMLTPSDIDAVRELIARAAVVVMQLETPIETIAHAIAVCQQSGVYTILDPTPVPPAGLPPAMFGVDLFTPNETEAQALLGVDASTVPTPKQIGASLLGRGSHAVVLKLGAKGSLIVGQEDLIQVVKPFKVNVVDTTAAGDAFTAGLAVAHAEGMELAAGVRFANAAGAWTCQSFGAQPALPARQDVLGMLDNA